MSESDRRERRHHALLHALHQTLRQGDPAGEEAGLSTAEAQAMRRAVLSAVPPRRERTFRLAPAFAAAAVAVLSLLVTFDLWRAHEEARTTRTTTATAPETTAIPRTATAPTETTAPVTARPPAPHPRPLSHTPSPRAGEGRRRPKSFPLSRGQGGRVGEGAGGEGLSPEPQRSAAGPAAEKAEPVEMRQVQFSTPGGTRIIWLLPETSEGAR